MDLALLTLVLVHSLLTEHFLSLLYLKLIWMPFLALNNPLHVHSMLAQEYLVDLSSAALVYIVLVLPPLRCMRNCPVGYAKGRTSAAFVPRGESCRGHFPPHPCENDIALVERRMWLKYLGSPGVLFGRPERWE